MLNRNNGFAAATLCFIIAFLYKMQPILHSHTCWCDFQNPDGFSEVIEPIIYGLLAIGFAIGIDIKALITQFFDKQK